MTQADYVSARQAIRRLDIKLQTLYSYVSRGMIRSVCNPGSKARLYLRADVERVQARAAARSGHGPVAAEAMHHGPPIITSAVTDITPQGPRYRGLLAVDLVRRSASFESVAELLWRGQWDAQLRNWHIRPQSRELQKTVELLVSSALRGLHRGNSSRLLEGFAVLVLHMGLADSKTGAPCQAEAEYEETRRILFTLAACCGMAGPEQRFVPLRRQERLCDGLLRALSGSDGTPAGREAVNAMLCLLADHELSPGTLSARVAASSGASLHGCLAAALSTSSGANVADVFDHVDDFLAGSRGRLGWTRQAMTRLARGASVPGFTHPLYPDGDPRAQALLSFIREQMPERPLLGVCQFIDDIEQRTGLHVRHEVPMVALCRAMGMPKGAAAAIFVIARTAGWLAHVREQRQHGQLMRPRARFVATEQMGPLHDQS